MKNLTHLDFVGIEFREDENEKTVLRSEVFVEIDNDGRRQTVQHQTELQDVSFQDFLTQEQINEFTQIGDNFSTFLGSLQQLLMYKVAHDLGIDAENINVKPTTPLTERMQDLETSQTDQDDVIMDLLLR